MILNELVGLRTHHHARLELLGELLQTGGQIHGFADDRVFHAFPGSQVTGGQGAGVEANADPKFRAAPVRFPNSFPEPD